MRQLRRYLELAPADRQLLLAGTFWLGLGRFVLWILPFQSILRIIGKMSKDITASANVTTAVRVAWAVDTASRYVPGARTCLPRALAATVLLRRAGVPADLRIGVTRGEGGRSEAHAWVESEGRVVIGEDELGRYVVVSALKGASR